VIRIDKGKHDSKVHKVHEKWLAQLPKAVNGFDVHTAVLERFDSIKARLAQQKNE
jgi:hypothetical protein